ncbi:MAG: Flp pilus assembly complex ATPase component TadA [Alphaproteobacteria bacterium]|uniref:Flp pilus assembly complex ATPase component TadA n=1 Tax=Candidatus Nitrobium versatile TaxID=2884831 RepID=A0A953J2A8_9BACT|nr:Flp pilus assembly complex ATPase component TadA [Candidatus Nitrobium versatile]
MSTEMLTTMQTEMRCDTLIEELLLHAVRLGASDLHLTELKPPAFRVDGDLLKVERGRVNVSDMNRFLDKYIPQGYAGLDGDFSFTFCERRWRGNYFHSGGKRLSLALRLLPLTIPRIQELRLPESFLKAASLRDGIILVTGPTGSGKSTTIAALIRHLLELRSVHLITIENPVEYLFEPTNHSIVNQREIGTDTVDIAYALKYALRQDPDVILVGEIRDTETARLAVNAAETGHLVFATLHTISVVETVNRLYGLFPPLERHLVQQQIASALRLVVAQRLVKAPEGGRRAVVEALFPHDPVRELIREGRSYEIPLYLEGAEYINTMGVTG